MLALSYGGKPITVLTTEAGEPEWIADEVCDALGLVKTDRALAGLDADEKGAQTVRTPGGPQRKATINESGLYSLILRSRKPEAKAFKRWVTHEVLPTIRKTGRYSTDLTTPQADLSALSDQIAQQSQDLATMRAALGALINVVQDLTRALAAPEAPEAPQFVPPTEWSGFPIEEILRSNLHIAMSGVYEWMSNLEATPPGAEVHPKRVWAPGVAVHGTQAHPGPGAYAWSSHEWIHVAVSADIWRESDTPAGRWLVERIVEHYARNAELLRDVEAKRRSGKRMSEAVVAEVYSRVDYGEGGAPRLTQKLKARRAA